MNKSTNRRKTIPADIAKELEELTGSGQFKNGIHFTDEQNAIILMYWPLKNRRKFTQWWCKKYGTISLDSLRRQYQRLAKEGE